MIEHIYSAGAWRAVMEIRLALATAGNRAGPQALPHPQTNSAFLVIITNLRGSGRVLPMLRSSH
jgi:hypothetical protein